jgi:hypothetical protein
MKGRNPPDLLDQSVFRKLITVLIIGRKRRLSKIRWFLFIFETLKQR